MAILPAYRFGGGSPPIIESAVSGSAFSRGAVLQFVGSKVSYQNTVAAALNNADIGAISLNDSADSINGLIPVQIIDDDDVFFVNVSGGDAYVRGGEYDLLDASGAHNAVTSTKTVRLVCVKSTDEVLGQSNASRILAKFITNAGYVDLT
jgi:hypothetical protein